ncbi:hypothetical protein R6Q57_014641 [Mikania cordata]
MAQNMQSPPRGYEDEDNEDKKRENEKILSTAQKAKMVVDESKRKKKKIVNIPSEGLSSEGSEVIMREVYASEDICCKYYEFVMVIFLRRVDVLMHIIKQHPFCSKLSDPDERGMVLPLLKLGTLALKTLSKPIAKNLKQQAAIHPQLRTSIIAFAQANHRLTTKIQRRIYGHAIDVEIRPLDEEKAVQAAGDLISELFVFSVLRQRDETLADELERLKQKIQELEHLSKGKGLAGVINFKSVQTQTANSTNLP